MKRGEGEYEGEFKGECECEEFEGEYEGEFDGECECEEFDYNPTIALAQAIPSNAALTIPPA